MANVCGLECETRLACWPIAALGPLSTRGPRSQGPLRQALEDELTGSGLQVVPEFVGKMVQIFDCKVRGSLAGSWWQRSTLGP